MLKYTIGNLKQLQKECSKVMRDTLKTSKSPDFKDSSWCESAKEALIRYVFKRLHSATSHFNLNQELKDSDLEQKLHAVIELDEDLSVHSISESRVSTSDG